MSADVVWLQAVAKELRECNCGDQTMVLGVIWRCPKHGSDEPAQQKRAVADLIDGMLAQYERIIQIPSWRLTEYGQGEKVALENDYLPMIVTLARSFSNIPVPEGT